MAGQQLGETQWQSLVSVTGIGGSTSSLGYWAKKTGAEVSATATQGFDGGSSVPYVTVERPTVKNIILTKRYRASVDQELVKRLQAIVGSWTTNVTVQDTDATLTPIGSPTVYPNAVLVRVQPPDVDADSSDVKMLEIEFMPTAVV